jgi:hypothetical protein
MSSVWVPILPVEPRMEIRFWKEEPLRASARVFWRDWGVLTGALGSIQLAPVPADPGGEKTERELVLLVLWRVLVKVLVGAKADVVEARRRPSEAEESFMVSFLRLFFLLCSSSVTVRIVVSLDIH